MSTLNPQERLEILDGARAGNRRRSAVRIEDLSAMLELPKLTAKTVTAAPTAEQHNALVKDLQNMHRALDLVARALQGKLRG